ncbi:type II toxin-antitoxin system VapC family toxin [Salinarimonas rosea]|uniref:type II toxin-antitoxin system VapC family toxin n=1 Tax=Salinarimonas rosea TaxID=552063 RepID=UPI00069425B2|nr:PIN domain-containing protein [Salinarimonas rosea]
MTDPSGSPPNPIDDGSRVYLDANALIALVEHRSPSMIEIQSRVEAGRLVATTSGLSRAEVLVLPLRERDEPLVAAYRELFSGEAGLQVVAISDRVLELAARIRAETSVKLADAIHLATAETGGCKVFLSSDRRIRPRAPMVRIGIERIADDT